MPARLESRCSLQLVTTLTERRASNALIRVGRLLDNHLLLPALARAAAHAEQPEQTRCDAKGNAEPHDLQHLVTHGGVDVVGLERSVEDTSQDAVDAGGGCGGGDGEDGRCLNYVSSSFGCI